MTVSRIILTASMGIAMMACGPSNVVPSSSDHPANASAEPGQPAPESETLATGMPNRVADGPAESEEPMDHSAHSMDPHAGHNMGATPSTPMAAEMATYNRAKPVFEEHCISCHTAKSKAGKHVAMDIYPFTGHHADEITSSIRRVLGLSGKKATMPKDDPGAVKGDQLALVVAWLDAFDRSHADAASTPADPKDGHSHKH